MELFKLIGRIAVEGTDEAEKDLNELTDTAEDSSNKIVDGFKKVGLAVAAAFTVDKIVEFGKATVEAGAEVAAEEAAFSQIMGDYIGEAAEKIGKIADATGIVDSRLTPYMTSMTAKFKGLGYDVNDATDYASRGLNLAADAAAFWDKSLDDSMSHLNSFINGSYEGGEAIGLFANDTQMAFYAMEKGIIADTKEWAYLEEAIKQATRLEYAENMFAMSGAVGQAAKESGAYANVQANLTESWRQFKAAIGEPLIEKVVIPAMKKLNDLVVKMTEGFEKASKWVSENKDKIEEWTGYIVAAGAGISAFLLYLNWGAIMAAAAKALGLVTLAIKKMNTAIRSNPIGLVIGLIVSLIAYLWYLYETNEDFRNKVNAILSDIWDKVKIVIDWLKQNVLPAIEPIFEWIKTNGLAAIQTVISWIKDNVLPVIRNIIEWLKTDGLAMLQEFIGWIQTTAIPAIKQGIEWVRENVLPVIQKIIEWIQNNIIPVVKTVIEWIVDKIGAFWDWIKGVFQSGSDEVGGVWDKIKEFFKSAWDFIVSVWEACQPFFKAIWENVILEVWDLIQQIGGAFKEAWELIKVVWDYVQPYFSAIWEAIKSTALVLWELLSTGFKNAWEMIKFVWNVAVDYFKLVWEGIKAVFSVVATILSGAFKVAWEAIKAIWNVVIDYFTMVWAGIKAVFAVVKGVLSGDFSDAWEAIKNLWSKVKDFFQSVWDGIKGVFGAVGSFFKNTFSSAWEAVKKVFSAWGSFFSGLWDNIKNTFSKIGTNISNAISSSVKAGLNGVIGSIEGIINGGINLINGAIGIINKIPGVDIGKIGELNLPRLAKGGVVTRSTIAEIGEDGAEAVVPLEKNTEWIDKLANKINASGNPAAINRMIELLEELTSMKIYLSNDVLVGELAPAMDSRLGDINRMRVRGR